MNIHWLKIGSRYNTRVVCTYNVVKSLRSSLKKSLRKAYFTVFCLKLAKLKFLNKILKFAGTFLCRVFP